MARNQWGLNPKIPVHEGCCVYDESPRYRVCRFWELVQISAASTVYLERVRDQAWLQNHHPPPSPQPGTRNRSVFWLVPRRTANHSLAGLLPCPQMVFNSSKTKQKGGGWQGGTGARLPTKICQKVCQNGIFWRHVRCSKTFRRHFCRDIYF
jgi:hypothetical protein